MANQDMPVAGRDFIVEFAFKEPANESDYKRLGSMRGKEFGAEWQTDDATTDTSPAFTQTNVVTNKQSSISFDGVCTHDALLHVDDIELFVNDPSKFNGDGCGQPRLYLRVTRMKGCNGESIRQYTGTALITSFRITAPYDGTATWALEGSDFAYTIEDIDASDTNTSSGTQASKSGTTETA